MKGGASEARALTASSVVNQTLQVRRSIRVISLKRSTSAMSLTRYKFEVHGKGKSLLGSFGIAGLVLNLSYERSALDSGVLGKAKTTLVSTATRTLRVSSCFVEFRRAFEPLLSDEHGCPLDLLHASSASTAETTLSVFVHTLKHRRLNVCFSSCSFNSVLVQCKESFSETRHSRRQTGLG